MINLSTKFEVSKFTHYEDTKGNAKCRNWGGGGFRRLGVMQGHQQRIHLMERVRFPTWLKTMRLSCTVFEL